MLTKRKHILPLGEQQEAVRRQLGMSLLGNFGSIFLGIAYALPTIMYSLLKDPNGIFQWTDSQITWFGSLVPLFCPIGGLISGYMVDRFGRKAALYMLNFLATISWMMSTFILCETHDGILIQMMLSRVVQGLATGFVGPPIGIYSSEISLPKIRSRLVLTNQLNISIGTLMIYLLGFILRDNWQLILKFVLLYQVIAFICIIPLPESPSWLLSKGRINEAKSSLNYFRGLERSSVISHPEVLEEYEILEKYVNDTMGAKKSSLLQAIHLPEVYKPMMILITLYCLQQLTGIFIMVMYTVQIAESAGVTIDPFLCAVLASILRVVTFMVLGTLFEKWGRRRCAMISATGMAISMLILALQNSIELLQKIPYLPLIAIVAYMITSTLGIFTLPSFMNTELYPQKVRGPASGVTLAIGIFLAFLTLKYYPGLQEIFGQDYCFGFFAFTSILALAFVYWFLPETRGRTLIQIEEEFRRKTPSKKSEAHNALIIQKISSERV